MRSLGSSAAVAAAVREDEGAEVERIDRETVAALARLVEEDAAAPVALPEREVRLGAARREARELLAQEDLRDAREALEARESWMRRAVVEGRKLLADPVPAAQRRADLARLAREGLDRLPGDPVEIVVAPADAALLDDAWIRDLAPGRAVRVVQGDDALAGGCVVQSGKVTFDNSLEARARRFEAAWRTALGALYQGRDT